MLSHRKPDGQQLDGARRILADYEIMAMVRKGQISAIPANDMPAQSAFVAALFSAAA